MTFHTRSLPASDRTPALIARMGCFWSNVKSTIRGSFDKKESGSDSSGRRHRNPRNFPAYWEISDQISRQVSRISRSRILQSSPRPDKNANTNTYISFADNEDPPVSSICFTCSTESDYCSSRSRRSQGTNNNNTSTMDNSFAVMDHFPSIYKITLDNQRELLDLYKEILSGSSGGGAEVSQKLAHHVSQSIEPTDWTGIWRASVPQVDPATGHKITIKCDFEVEVIDVTHNTLDAVVILRKLLSPLSDRLTTSQFDLIEAFMQKEKVKTVPLIELYVISEKDENERLLPTAVVIEQVRFFVRFMSRPWDDLQDAAVDRVLSCSKLESRLTLYFDIKQKLLPESTIKKISRILSEARRLRKEFDDISRAVSDQQSGDREEDADSMSQGANPDADLIDETEFYQAMRLKLKLEELQRQLEMIEDPYLRLVATASNTADDDDEPSDGNMIHVLCKKLTKSVMQTIAAKMEGQDEEREVSFHKSFAHVLKCSTAGDRVLILPGCYTCDALPWLDFDLEVTGLSDDPALTVLQSTDAVGDVFINCSANAILIRNITIRTPVETQSVIMVHSGVTDLVNCIVDGGRVARNTLIALSKADVAMDNCKIIHKDTVLRSPAAAAASASKKKTSPPRMGICRRPGGNVSIDGENFSFVNDADDDEDESPEELARFYELHATASGTQQSNPPDQMHDDDSDAMSISSEVKILNTVCHNLPRAVRSDYC